MRVISLSPAVTETIFALGADKHLVGVTYFCNYPAECHPQCTLAAFCIQEARAKHHAGVSLQVEPGLQ